MPSKGKGGALSGLADRRILRNAAGRSVQRTPGRAFPQEGPGRSVSADRRCACVTPPDAEASARRGAVFRHRPSTDYRVKRETRMLRKKSEGCRARECRSGRLGGQTRGVPDFAEEARGAWSGEISPDVSAGRRDGKIRVTARKRGIFQSVGNSGNRGESRERRGGAARDGAQAEDFLMTRRAGGGRCVFLGELPDGGARHAGEGPKGFPRVPGQALIPPVLREAAGETGVVRAFCLPEHQTRRAALPDAGALAKSSAEGTSLGGVPRRGVEAPAFRISGRTSGDKADVVRPSCRIPPEKKAACVSGGSAERPQFSRTGRARQRGRRSRRREPDPAGVFSMVMHPMIRREEFGCNRSGAGIFRKDCRATGRWHDLGAWRRERRRNRAQRRVKVLSHPPGAACCVCGEMATGERACDRLGGDIDPRPLGDLVADIVASKKGRFLDMSYCQSY